MNRARLRKLVGKEVDFTATLGKKNDSGNNVIITDVKYKGKFYADHLWISSYTSLSRMEIGTEISFTARVYTYTDSFGVRKNGVRSCHNFNVVNEVIELITSDRLNQIKRINNA